jgi:flavin-dependent dehydrogenase
VFSALRAAELVAETATRAFRLGDWSWAALAGYERARRAAFGGKERFTRALQFVVRRRGLADLVAHRLARRPALVDLLLGVAGDYVPPRALLGNRVFPRA